MDLLSFLLVYGGETLDFESDSEFYSGDEGQKPSVAEFIYSAINADGNHLINPVYDKVYTTYVEMFLKSVPQERIVHNLLNSPDRDIQEISAQLSVEKYPLTVKNFEAALTTTSSWLVTYVPKAILVYVDKKLESAIFALRKRLTVSCGELEQEDTMREMIRLQNVQRQVKAKMKRQ